MLQHGKEKQLRRDKSSGESIEGLLERFDQSLESILGSGRQRNQKRAKAEEAIRAVDELVADIETGFVAEATED